jgi:hypothetical protein
MLLKRVGLFWGSGWWFCCGLVERTTVVWLGAGVTDDCGFVRGWWNGQGDSLEAGGTGKGTR